MITKGLKFSFVGLILLVLNACTDSSNGEKKDNIMGIWVSAESETAIETDLIEFRSDVAIIASVEYQYSYDNDSITFTYEGPFSSATISSTHHYFFANAGSSLYIENGDNLFLFAALDALVEFKRVED